MAWTRRKWLNLTQEEIDALQIELQDLTPEERATLPWYEGIRKLWDTGADYIMAFGGRSNGKTFDVLKLLLNEYKTKKTRFVYVRRWKDDINTHACETLFKQELIDTVFGPGYEIRYYRSTFRLVNTQTDTKEDIGYAAAVSEAKHKKGTNYPGVGIMFFDEFIDMAGELPLANEYNKFENILSTVKRANKLRVIMCANTVSKYSEYFTKLGINSDKIKQGEVKHYLHPNGRNKVVCEYTQTHPVIKHLVGNLTNSSMISSGEWEIDPVDELPSAENERVTEKLLFTAYQSNIDATVGVYVRFGEWESYEVVNGLVVPVEHEREFLVIRRVDNGTKSSYFNLTEQKSLNYTHYHTWTQMIKDIMDTVGIDVMHELRMGRVFCDDMFTADIFTQIFMHYNSTNNSIRKML